MNVERLNLITYISLIIIVIAFFFACSMLAGKERQGHLLPNDVGLSNYPL